LQNSGIHTEMPVEYYELKRVTIEDSNLEKMNLRSAALIVCGLCGECINGMGGPGNGSICMPCGDLVRRGAARGAIKWDNKS
jgi:hypothetical protein